MKNFIEGILFISFIIPFLENILTVIAQAVEWLCTKIAVSTYNLKKSIGQVEEAPASNTHAIGFRIPEVEEEEIQEDEEEEE